MSLTTLGVGGGARWFVGAAEAIDFANGWSLSGGAPSSLLTTTRASTAWAPNAAGVYTSFSSNTPRITDLGLLTEEARTNSIRNNSMQGAVAGTPGTLPTNWIGGLLSASGSTQTLALATTNGIDFLNYGITGATPSATAGVTAQFDAVAQVAATPGQVWTGSMFGRVVSGDFTGFSAFDITVREYDSGSVFLRQTLVNLMDLTSSVSRRTNTVTMGASTAFVMLGIRCSYTGAAVNLTLGIGWPQLELGSFATSPIRTTSAAATRAADAVSLTTVPVSGGTWSAFVDATSPDNSATRYFLAEASGNRVIYSSGSNVAASAFNGSAAVSNGVGPTGGWATGGRAAVAASGAGRSVAFNNSAVGTDANTQTFPTTLYLGGVSSGALGAVTTRRIALWSVRLPDPQLQALTA